MSCGILLNGKGLKLTSQRKLILNVLHHSRSALAGEDITRLVQARAPRVNKSTVYRTLGLLERLGCVYKSESGERAIYRHSNDGRHYHLECHSCGRTTDCDEDIFQPMETAIAGKYGFQVSRRHTIMRGLCRECRSRMPQEVQ